MTKLKKEYCGGGISLIVWRDGDNQTVISSLNYEYLPDRFLQIQETPGSEVIGAFFEINEKGFKAVSERLYDNMLAGRERVITLSDLEEVLCEPNLQ